LGAADRCHIPAWAGADYCNIEGLSHVWHFKDKGKKGDQSA
jgi:hypothetical protein